MLRTSVSGSAYLGVFGRVVGDTLVIRSDITDESVAAMGEELETPVITTTIGGGSTVGSLIAGNRTGAIVSSQATTSELDVLTTKLDRPVKPLPDTLNAAGNLILATDTGAIIHPEISAEGFETIRETLDVPVIRSTIGTVKTVGMAAVATENGVLCHPRATEDELDTLEETLDVPADLGTVNYGSPLVGSGLLATTAGYVVGERTTGPELGRIEDALDLID